MKEYLRVGVAGLGTVGSATVRLLAEQQSHLLRHCKKQIVVTAVSARDKNKERSCDLKGIKWYSDPLEFIGEVDVVIELIGGSEGIAKKLIEASIKNGKHVVTANKALIAHHGQILAKEAEEKDVVLAFEAAVAGGIPILKVLREGLCGNNIDGVYGILNGTCNYVLTKMRETGEEFDVALKEAQKLGYAEADPTFDVDGIDAAHKLSILTTIAFSSELDFSSVFIEGIRNISPIDFDFAEELGYRIKLLGITRQTLDGVEQRVHPCMVPLDAPIAHIEDVFNAIVVHGDYVGTTMYEGRGAGAGPTASSVVADLIDVANGRVGPVFGVMAKDLKKKNINQMKDRVGSYFVRFLVVDKPGVFAEIAAALRDNNVSMERIIQRGRVPGEAVQVALTTHETREQALLKAIETIDEGETTLEPTNIIRIEPFLFMS